MDNLEFCTTATIRPEIIDATYQSFCSQIADVNFKTATLYLNIDPLPEGNPQDVIDVAKKYFGTVVANTPSEPNFTNALKWCWSQVRGDYFFNLEDDWILLRSIEMNALVIMLQNLRKSRYHIGINLRAYPNIRNGVVCLSPCLLDAKWAKRAVSLLSSEFNPEKQLRIGSGVEIKPLCFFKTVQYPRASNEILIKDIGREWLEKNNDYQRGIGNGFIRWKKTHE